MAKCRVRFFSIIALAFVLLSPETGHAQSAKDGFDPGTNGNVLTLAMQRDGKILVGGRFDKIGGGGTGITPRSKIARVNPDGCIDPNFNPGANEDVISILVQPDGKILVGGFFSKIGGGGTGQTTRKSSRQTK